MAYLRLDAKHFDHDIQYINTFKNSRSKSEKVKNKSKTATKTLFVVGLCDMTIYTIHRRTREKCLSIDTALALFISLYSCISSHSETLLHYMCATNTETNMEERETERTSRNNLKRV